MKKLIIALFVAMLPLATFAQEKIEMNFNHCNNDTFKLVKFNLDYRVATVVVKLNNIPDEASLKQIKNVRFNWFYCIKELPKDTISNHFYGIKDACIVFEGGHTGKVVMDASVESKVTTLLLKGDVLTCCFRLTKEQVKFLKCSEETRGLPDEGTPGFSPGNLHLTMN